LLVNKLGSENIEELNPSPVSKLRIVKNDNELNSIRKALEIESAVLISFYANIHAKLKLNNDVYEHEADSLLDELRQ
jgi:Xaa-Pro aminopeptidase